MDYECPYARRDNEYINCVLLKDGCPNVRYCLMGGRYKLTEFAMKCPKRVREEKKKK